MFEKIVKMYEYLFVEVSGYRNYVFNPTDMQIKMINNFIKKKEGQIGDNWLFDFFLFQFSRYHEQKTRFGTGKVQFTWVIGNKALLYWKNRTAEQQYYADELKVQYGLKNPLLPKKELKLSDDYFTTKRKEKNLLECVRLRLYNERDKVCRFCKHKLICKEL